MLSCEFYEISKNAFFTEHLWATASVFIKCHLTQKAHKNVNKKYVNSLALLSNFILFNITNANLKTTNLLICV